MFGGLEIEFDLVICFDFGVFVVVFVVKELDYV